MTNKYQNFITQQTSPHPNLVKIVKHHINTKFLRPLPNHQINTFQQIQCFINSKPGPIILDSGCGTGLSTQKLAEIFSDHVVVGIDKSMARLARANKPSPQNCLLIRGNLIDLWRLMSKNGLQIKRHYLFFPNPWPKASQIKRRFHAHPVFETMVFLSDYLELRTNWRIYAEELIDALQILGQKPICTIKTDNQFMTFFEKKYMESNNPIYIIINNLI
jgi:tRNA (guanine-N7-)-methyltransferase